MCSRERTKSSVFEDCAGHGSSSKRPGESWKDGATEMENQSLYIVTWWEGRNIKHACEWSNNESGRKALRRADRSEDMQADKHMLG